MKSLKCILSTHKETPIDTLIKIVKLKTKHWKYTEQQHFDWFEKNIQNNDYHLRIENDKDEIIAYLNLVEIVVSTDNSELQQYLGIGNVCVDDKMEGKGLGLYLMQTTNFLLKQLNRKGSLICKTQLHNFYTKSNWIQYDGFWTINNNSINANIYFLEKINSNKINIDKNF